MDIVPAWAPGSQQDAHAFLLSILFYSKKKMENKCDVLNSVLSYIELRKDIAFTLNSEIQ